MLSQKKSKSFSFCIPLKEKAYFIKHVEKVLEVYSENCSYSWERGLQLVTELRV